MSARVVLSPRSNSHPFQERNIVLDQPLKIGRSVARSKPGPTNAIFDCKVLSRNHALLWYEAGQFYLQDTKSSNGTFINSVRLSKSSEESPPTPISSGDVLQFGVDVMELTKKVTHGCIVASLQLFTPDGKEAKGNSNSLEKFPPTSLQDIYAIHQCLREATDREAKIESKLVQMQKLLDLTLKSVEMGWSSLIEEDRLLTRIDMLERQLQACHKSTTDDKLREEVINLLEDKNKYQVAYKESMRKLNEEKLQYSTKYKELERTIQKIEEEHATLLLSNSRTNDELDLLATKLHDSEKKRSELAEEIGVMSLKYTEETLSLNQRLESEQELSKSRNEVIENLLNKVDSSTSPDQSPKIFTGSHNDDLAALDKEGNQIYKSDFSAGDATDELVSLRRQLKDIDTDKKEVISRLTTILSFVESLKGLTNKSHLGDLDYIQQLVSQLEGELHSAKNYAFGLNSSGSRIDGFDVNDDDIRPKLNNHNNEHDSYTNCNNLSTDSIKKEPQILIKTEICEDKKIFDSVDLEAPLKNDTKCLQKLLDEARDLIGNLKGENAGLVSQIQLLNKEREHLKENLARSEKIKMEALTKEVKLTQEIKLFKEMIDSGNAQVENLTKELELKALEVEQLTSEKETLKIGMEKQSLLFGNHVEEVKEIMPSPIRSSSPIIQIPGDSLEGTYSSCQPADTSYSSLNGSQSSLLLSKLTDAEEELAILKTRCSESASECSRLKEMLNKEENRQILSPFLSRPTFWIPILLVLLLAVLIVFHPMA